MSSNEKSFKKFTNLYSLTKTLRFELIPKGKTLENIEKNGIISQDERRAGEYKKVKKIMDECHKDFIEEGLEDFSFNENSLQEYENLAKITNKDEKQKKDFENIQSRLRKEIVKTFDTKRLFGKELIQEDLCKFLEKTDLTEFYKKENTNKEECKRLVSNFSKWTTYFKGFNENRKNMYSDEEKSTAIAYRLVNDNLPKFIGNILVFEKTKDKIQDNFGVLKNELGLSEGLGHYFDLNNYNKFLSQSGIDLFNTVIGGRTTHDGTKIKGLNEYINLYNQTQTNKNDKLPKFTPLFKMILSDRTTLSWLPEQFENDNDVLDAINDFYRSIAEEKSLDGQTVLEQLKGLLREIKPAFFDLSKIYLRNDTGLTSISKKFLGRWDEIQKAVEAKYEETHPKGKTKSQEKYDEEKEKHFKRFDSISLKFINECTGKNVENYFAELNEEKDENENIITKSLFDIIADGYNAVEGLLNTKYPADKSLAQDESNVKKIKGFLDGIMELLHFTKPLCGKGNETDKDEKFYGEFLVLFEKLRTITKLYDKVRNHMTKKSYSTEKVKLNFGNYALCDGWDKNKEQTNTAILLRKGEYFYLAIMNYSEKTIFDNAETPGDGELFYEKIDYKFFPDASKMIPKCSTQLKDVKKHFQKESNDISISDKFVTPLTISKRVYDLNNMVYDDTSKQIVIKNNNDDKRPKLFQSKYLELTKNQKVYGEALKDWIDFCKMFLAKYESTAIYNFKFKNKTFDSLDKFYRYINTVTYEIRFRNISEKYIHQLVEENKLYLFQLYNKDFSEYSKGTPNMHTLYWKELFSVENFKNIVYKLNGEAEIFYRKRSINYSDEILKKGHHYEELKDKIKDKKTGKFYPIIKDRRFAFDKFQFHCPITLNFKASGNEYINEDVNDFIKKDGIKHIIGIDRGERHLLYVSVIDLNGNIKEQFSLNEIVNEYDGNEYKTDYHKLLDNKGDNRTKQRKEWQTIENIKELKNGYLSQVVHKISELMVKYDAIVVLEDLNLSFMRGRQKIEKSVYQQFEKKLIDKLNYLVFKKKNKNEIGGTLNALQLTSKFKSFKDIGKQCGFLFYVAAWNTSKIDPSTGFVNMFDCRYENVDSAKAFFSNFCDIRYNKEKCYFEFIVDNYSKFNSKAIGTRKDWIICTNGERIRTYRNQDKNNQWDNERIVLTDEFKKLFTEHKIDFNSDLKTKILAQTEKSFFNDILHLFKLTVQMRNSITGTDTDNMISPVANEDGKFFDSENPISATTWPENADANGAYNIARKGLILVEKIKNADNLKKINLTITNKEYLQFVQK